MDPIQKCECHRNYPPNNQLQTMERGSLITIIGIKRAINFVTVSACQFHEMNIKLISMIEIGDGRKLTTLIFKQFDVYIKRSTRKLATVLQLK